MASINLRKASAILVQLNEELKDKTLQTSVEISEHQDPEEVLDAARLKALGAIEARNEILKKIFTLRSAVSKANHESGVNSLLAQMAHVERVLSLYAEIKLAPVRLEPKVLLGKIRRMKDVPAEKVGYMGMGDVTTGVFDADAMKAFADAAASLKKEKMNLQDALLDKNVTTYIEYDLG